MSTGPIAFLSIPATLPSMDHPPSPSRAHSHMIQDGHSPSSPQGPPPPHHMAMAPEAHHSMGGYRGGPPPPPGSYGPPPGYPPYQGHGGPPQSPYGAGPPPPPHGYPRGLPGGPGGYPGAGYPPHHHSPSYPNYGYHPGNAAAAAARQQYYGGFEGGYPGQQPPQASPFRSPLGVPRPGVPTSSPEAPHSSPKASPQGSDNKSSPSRSPDMAMQTPISKLTENMEVERLRAAAAQELTAAEVRPIETDFHFFVKANMEDYRKLAEAEMRETTKEGEPDLYLVNTNLNERLLTAWETMNKETRDIYTKKEDDDRRRFMEEDEIASRHCATLTARGKSPRDVEKDKKKEERQESNTKPVPSPNRDSPTPKSGSPSDTESEGSSSGPISPQKSPDTSMEVDTRNPSKDKATSGEETEIHQSPAKKSRLAEKAEE